MSRRSRRQSDATVSLFPFLAVLICTMGSLIVLLVVVVQQAGQQIPEPELEPATVAQELPPDVEKQHDLEQLREDLSWEAEMLTHSRDETLRRLKEQQAELSRAEDQTRQIKAELDRLYAESQNLDAVHQQQHLTAEQVEAEQQALQKQISAAAQRLAAAQDAAERKKRQYSLVPYEGPNGTQRRPIFIECLNDRVVLQPEGVILKSDDFLPPVRSDNALASAIRAIREYYLNNGIVRTSTEPYPLIVVRPSGASAFAACRGALDGWDDEFGYELLPQDMELAYPPFDPSLRALLERTVEEARWRKQQSLIPNSSEMVLSVDRRTGGFVRKGAGHDGAASRGNASGNGRRGGVFEDGSRDAAGASSRLGASGASGGVASGGPSDADRGSAFEGAGGGLGNGAEGHAAVAGSSKTPGDNPQDVAMQPGTYSESRGGQAGSGQGTDTESGDAPSFDALAGIGDDFSGASAGANQGAPSGGQASQQANGAATRSGQTAGQAQAGGSAGAGSVMRSIARSQGANWALPGAADGAIAIQRPVNVRCAAGALELLPEAGTDQSPVAIPCGNGTESAVREMVSALWSRVDGWGIAGTGTYWKPVVEVLVTPDGETRFIEVAALLENSGLIVIRR